MPRGVDYALPDWHHAGAAVCASCFEQLARPPSALARSVVRNHYRGDAVFYHATVVWARRCFVEDGAPEQGEAEESHDPRVVRRRSLRLGIFAEPFFMTSLERNRPVSSSQV